MLKNTLFLVLFSPLIALAQTQTDDFDPYSISPTKIDLPEISLKLDTFPFGNIIVLDNRIEKGYFFVGEPFPDMPTWYTLGNSTAAAIRQYCEKEIGTSKKGNETLLLNIKSLRVPNSMTILNGKGGSVIPVRAHEMLSFYVEAWQKIGQDSWIPLTNIHTFSEMQEPDFPEKTIATLLTKLLHTIASGIEDKANPPILPLSKIDHPHSDDWSNLNIVKKPVKATGYFLHFTDFQKNRLTIPQEQLQVIYNPQDSIYTLNDGPWQDSVSGYMPWAVAFQSKLYYNVGWNKYVLLEPRNNTFYFYLPHSLPDAYTMLGKAIMPPKDPAEDDYDPGEINNFGDLTVAIIGSWIHNGTKRSREKEKLRQPYITIAPGKDYGYRSCYLDLDTGDIVY